MLRIGMLPDRKQRSIGTLYVPQSFHSDQHHDIKDTVSRKRSQRQQDWTDRQRDANCCNENDQPEHWIALLMQRVKKEREEVRSSLLPS